MARLRERHPELAPACARLTALSSWAHHALIRLGLDRTPSRVIHGDWHPGNTLMRDARVVGVIDFDAARLGELGVDLAQGLTQFSLASGGSDPARWDDAPVMERLLALWRGYTGEAGVPDAMAEGAPLLMVETLIKEAASGIDTGGNAGRRSGRAFLDAVARKGEWLQANAASVTRALRESAGC